MQVKKTKGFMQCGVYVAMGDPTSIWETLREKMVNIRENAARFKADKG